MTRLEMSDEPIEAWTNHERLTGEISARSLGYELRAEVVRITVDLGLRDAGLIPVGDAGIVAEEKHSAFRDVPREQVPGPQDPVLGPCCPHVPPQSM